MDVDTDTDGLKDSWEARGWGTDSEVIDSDGDSLGDCREAADVDGNGVVNFSGDTIAVSLAAQQFPAVARSGVFDIDKNGVVNFTGDALTAARFGQITGLCK
jgi:hypothetical protein